MIVMKKELLKKCISCQFLHSKFEISCKTVRVIFLLGIFPMVKLVVKIKYHRNYMVFHYEIKKE